MLSQDDISRNLVLLNKKRNQIDQRKRGACQYQRTQAVRLISLLNVHARHLRHHPEEAIVRM